MAFRFNWITLNELNGNSFNVNKNIYYHVKEANNRIKQKLDAGFIITGGVGSGKSNFAKGLHGTHMEVFRKKKYNLDKHVHFLLESVLDAFDDTKNKKESINFDEAVQGATGKDTMTKLGSQLNKKFVTKRFKGHLFTLCIDNLKSLSEKSIDRSIAWYHVRYVRDKRGKYRKGIFKVFTRNETLLIWEDLKKNKYRFVEEHPIYKSKLYEYICPNFENNFYSEEDYDKKKDIETSKIPDEEINAHTIQRNKLIKEILNKKIMTQQQIANIIGLSRTAVSDINAKMTT